jgi:hypothetical protein
MQKGPTTAARVWWCSGGIIGDASFLGQTMLSWKKGDCALTSSAMVMAEHAEREEKKKDPGHQKKIHQPSPGPN